MAVTSEASKTEVTANGITTAFATGFKFGSSSELKVYLVSAGVATLQTLGTHYSVTGAGLDAGGTVTFTTAPANGVTVRIRRVVPFTQEAALRTQGPFTPSSLENALDKLTHETQQLNEDRLELATRVDSVVASAAAATGDSLVTSTGSTTARKLKDRHAELRNVKDYGAVGNGVADDYAGIQAAIDAAAAAGGGAVYVPPGTYLVGRPLRIKTSNIRLLGAGRYASTIRSNGLFYGPLLYVGVDLTVPTAASLLTGAGSSIDLGGQDNFVYLRESAKVALDGLSQLCVEITWRPSATNADMVIVSSRGKLVSSDAVKTCFTLLQFNGGILTGAMTIGGVQRNVQSAAGFLVAGTTYRIALTYDGATLRLFANGALVASAAATGTVTQAHAEDMTIGHTYSQWPEATAEFSPARGPVDGLHISNTARYTAAYTAPTAKPTADANTLLLVNFDDIQNGFVVGSDGEGRKHWLHVRKQGAVAEAFRFNIQVFGLGFDGANRGSGILAFSAPSCDYGDIFTFDCFYGIFLCRGSYRNHMSNIRGRGLAAAWSTKFIFGNVNQCGNNVWQHVVASQAPVCIVATNSSIDFDGVDIYDTRDVGMLLQDSPSGSEAAANINALIISDEAQFNPMVAALVADGIRSMAVAGSIFEVANSNSPLVRLEQMGASSFSGCAFVPRATAPSVFHFAGTQNGRAVVLGPRLTANVPWANASQDSLAVLDGALRSLGIYESNQPAAAIQHLFKGINTATGKLVSVQNNGEKLAIASTGKLLFDGTAHDTSGTPGSATVNRPAGISAIGAGGTAMAITNNTVATTSKVFIVPLDIDANISKWKVTVTGAGFEVAVNAGAAATWRFAWFVLD